MGKHPVPEATEVPRVVALKRGDEAAILPVGKKVRTTV